MALENYHCPSCRRWLIECDASALTMICKGCGSKLTMVRDPAGSGALWTVVDKAHKEIYRAGKARDR